MNNAAYDKPAHLALAARAVILPAILLGVWLSPCHAGQSSGQFNVTINLQTGNPAPIATTGLCRSSTGVGMFGAALTVVCATGDIATYSGNPADLPWATIPNNPYRLVTTVTNSGEMLGTIDSYTGAGTITSWRVLKLTDRDYLEMMVHW